MRRRSSRFFFLAIGIPLLLAMLSACGAGTTGSGGGTTSGPITIKIGSDFPVTGKDQSAGTPAQNGVKFAIDEANASKEVPNVTFSFDPKDDVGPSGVHDPAVGQQNVTSLIGDAQVVGIVGPTNSNVAQAEMPVANQAPIALISPANTNDCLTQSSPEDVCGKGVNSKFHTYRPTGNVTYFRTATRDQFQGAVLADFGYKDKNYKKVYVIDDAETYGVGLATSFITEWQKLGGTVLGRKSEPGTTTSFVSVLTQIAATNPDLIFFGGNDSTGGTLIRQQMLQVAALKNTPFEVGDGGVTPAFAQNIVPIGGGPVFGSIAVDNNALNAAKNFQSQFTAKYGTFGSYTAGAYDDAKILIQAVKNVLAQGKVTPPQNSGDAAAANTFRQAVIDAVKNINYTGVTGHHTFDSNGDTTDRAISIYTLGDLKVNNGWQFLTQKNA
ncbi:MAG TPA: branched-chain amino acid ABC transporter substrate-binding protein [Ktedonobacteraceae bacterium]|jgi:branched-chain amino acid transport system substrate-binding protein